MTLTQEGTTAMLAAVAVAVAAVRKRASAAKTEQLTNKHKPSSAASSSKRSRSRTSRTESEVAKALTEGAEARTMTCTMLTARTMAMEEVAPTIHMANHTNSHPHGRRAGRNKAKEKEAAARRRLAQM